jgi:hypothetical protein
MATAGAHGSVSGVRVDRRPSLVSLHIVAGKAMLASYEMSKGGIRAEEATARVELPAESLRLALNALIEGDARQTRQGPA